MTGAAPSLWLRSYLVLAVVSFLLNVLHIGDDLIRGENITMGNDLLFGLGMLVLGVLFVFGVLWSWLYRSYGFWVVLVLSLSFLWGVSLSHIFELGGAHSLQHIGTETGAWGPIMVSTSLLGGVAALSTALLAIYLLSNPGKMRQGT